MSLLTPTTFGATLALACAAFGCSAPADAPTNTGSTTEPESANAAKLHAVDGDPATSMVIVTTPDFTFPLLATNGTGYRLNCPTAAGMEDLIRGTGIDPAMVPLFPKVSLNSPEVETIMKMEIVRLELIPVLSCNVPDTAGGILSINVDGAAKYFLDIGDADDDGKPILHNVGCLELPRAMGLDPDHAEIVDVRTAKRHFRMDDKYDIHCAVRPTGSCGQ